MKKTHERQAPSSRALVLSVLGLVTLGVAALSVYVSYQILEPRFGPWSAPTVAALDALWCVFQATEILAGSNRRRARRVQVAGLVLTAINAAIPTTDLILHGGFDLAVILTPVAIVATKGAWWLTLPSLGRRTSAATRQTIDAKRQEVADRLEVMEAEAAHRIELLATATDLDRRVAQAETRYRLTQLEIRQSMTEQLHAQAEATQATVTQKQLPATVAAIELPDFDTWTPSAPALLVTADRDENGTGTPALPGGRAASGTHRDGSHAGQRDGEGSRHGEGHGERDGGFDADMLARLAAVKGVPTPQPGEYLSDSQLEVLLRHLRYGSEPAASYRQARDTLRARGFVGSESRIRHAWAALMSQEESGEADDETEEEIEEEDAGA